MLRFYKQGQRLFNLALIVKATPHDAEGLDYTHLVFVGGLEVAIDPPYDQFLEFMRLVATLPEGVYHYNRESNMICQLT